VLYLEVPVAVANAPPVLESPGDRAGRQGDTVDLPLRATDSDGDSLYFDGMGLPQGLVLDHGTGEISGTLTSSGTSTVTASVSDGPEVSVVTFEWIVAAPFCGDDVLDDGEQCDDGNAQDGDGCSAMCEIETPPLPDGGLPDAGPDGSIGGGDGGVSSDGGGGCGVARSRAAPDPSIVWFFLALAFLSVRRRAV